MELRPDDFAGFFRAIHGYDPFPWQQALVDSLAKCGAWPDVLDLPTGSGKTAALDAAVFHLALRANAPRLPALRIALVVDRRLVVDDAFARAERIANALCGALSTGAQVTEALKEAASRLRGLAGENTPPLIARRLRGGAPLEHDWARTPTQPTILCSTVDQVGSRLLFRGYGVSDRMKPVHAGLLGTDTLILLDEAHLSEPFRQTLGAVREMGGAGTRVALLSATPGVKAERPFRLTRADRNDPLLRKRLVARKPVTMKPPVRGQTRAVAEAFADEADAMMKRLREEGVSPSAVGVVVNRVALARRTYERLRQRLKEIEGSEDGTIDLLLLIGRSRDVDRDRVAHRLDPFRSGSSADERSKQKPLFVVATQCLEVGVDLDLDGLVTQAAPLDALRQRFGRLNRAGREGRAEGMILALGDDIAKRADDPVYGDRIRLTWEALKDMADNGTVDFGVEVLPERLREVGIDENALASRRSDAPVVMPAYLDLWSHTSPRPAADPEVSLFLHGAELTDAGVSVVWRGDISESDLTATSEVDLQELCRLVPPRAAEAVEVPLPIARAWLRGDAVGDMSMSDVPGREAEAPAAGGNRGAVLRAFRWAGVEDPRTGVVEAQELRTGDLLIVPATYGRCDEFGWAPESDDPVRDAADDAAEPYWGRRCAVRVMRELMDQDQVRWDRVSERLGDDGATGEELVDRLLDALPSEAAIGSDKNESAALQVARRGLEALQRSRGRIDVHFPYSGGRENGVVIVAEQGVATADVTDTAPPATEDDHISHTSKRPVDLNDHSRRVARIAKGFAQTLGIEVLAEDLGLAAYLHDVGKADRRFQTMLSGGDPWNRRDGTALAKTGRSRSPSAWQRAGLPKGWRHEALSVRMARSHPRFSEARDPALVLWLIGSHHGLGRPFFDFLDPAPDREPLPCLDVTDWQLPEGEPGPQSLAFDFDGADWPTMFEGLKWRYGIWGLAHLEAILRLADHRASEEEERMP